jgi:sodium/hydrogen antiporter
MYRIDLALLPTDMDHFGIIVALVGIVIVVASLLSGALERSGIPLVAAFLGLGALLGAPVLGLIEIGFESPALHALSMLGLALVLFSDAVTIETTEMRAHRRLLWLLLGPGTLIPAVVVAISARVLLDVAWPAAAILGAALASTDPVLLRSMLRARALPRTAKIALRIETGMNDVVLLPVVMLSMLWMTPRGTSGVGGETVVRSIVGLFVLGPVLGAFVGWAGIRMLAAVRTRFGVRRDYESLYALGLAFAGFAAAEAVGGSGFLAAFAAGLMVGSQDVELCDCFLEYGEATAEMLLLLTFVALGTSLIWTGLSVITVSTLLFAVVALCVRTAVLFPVLSSAGAHGMDRRLIALFGPRGLSSLLLALLPVFAGIAGAQQLFAITSLVVLLSVVLHGGGIAWFLRRATATASTAPTTPGVVPLADVDESPIASSITLDELRALQARGDDLVLADARRERDFEGTDRVAAGAVRLHPDDPVRDAREQRLSQHATVVVYCA